MEGLSWLYWISLSFTNEKATEPIYGLIKEQISVFLYSSVRETPAPLES